MMIIDSHVHVRLPDADSKEKALKKGGRQFAGTIEVADRDGVDKLCILGDGDLLLRLIAEHPGRLFGFLRINPHKQKKSLEEIDCFLPEDRMVGIKIGGGGPAACKASEPVLDPIVKRVNELNGLVLMHAWNKTTGNFENESTPFEVADLASRHPDAKIQMAHLNGAGFRGILDIAPYENVFVDTSGSYPEAGMLLEWAVEVMGPERIVYGSDIPGRDFGPQLSKVVSADLSDDVKKLILAENMINWMGVDQHDN